MTESQLLSAIIELVEQVGDDQVEQFRSSASRGEEKMTREYVSEVDFKAEKTLHDELRKLLPAAGFLGEETGLRGDRQLRWVVDPLDGTTNFLSGLDQFSISVALEEEEKTRLAVVYRPCSREIYSAIRGEGLFHNGRLCNPAHADALKSALLGTGFPYRSPDLADNFFTCAREVLYKCRGIRRFGSAALDLCYVAAGYLQGFWESDLQPYDVAAAVLFMEETGCQITNQRGEPYNPYRDRLLVCAPPRVHSELLPIVKHHYPAQLD